MGPLCRVCTGVWVFAWRADFVNAVRAIGIVSIEVFVLAFNNWRCPLSAIAARYTEDRRANFDIYLPEWLAAHNMPIFGTMYVVGVALTLVRWTLAASEAGK